MLSITHASIAVAGTTLLTGEISSLGILLSIAGSQIPDLDTSKSMAGRIFYPIATWIEQRYTHRTITHSLLATATIALLSSPLIYYFSLKIWLCLWLGHLLSCFSDTITKEGVGLFWPSPDRCIYGVNPNYRLRTGSTVEFWVLGFFVLLSIWSVNLQSSGGLMVNFGEIMGLPEAIERTYNNHGASNQIWVSIEGYKDNRAIEGKFFVIAQDGNRWIVKDRSGIYRTDDQIKVNRIRAEVGPVATTTGQQIALDDESAVEALNAFRSGLANSAIFLSGEITVDEPEEILKTTPIGEYKTIERTGNGVSLSHCPIERAIEVLSEQFATGTLTAKIVTPAPEL